MVEYKMENLNCHDLGTIFVFPKDFARGVVNSVSHAHRIKFNNFARYCLAEADRLQSLYYTKNLGPRALWFLIWRLNTLSSC